MPTCARRGRSYLEKTSPHLLIIEVTGLDEDTFGVATVGQTLQSGRDVIDADARIGCAAHLLRGLDPPIAGSLMHIPGLDQRCILTAWFALPIAALPVIVHDAIAIGLAVVCRIADRPVNLPAIRDRLHLPVTDDLYQRPQHPAQTAARDARGLGRIGVEEIGLILDPLTPWGIILQPFLLGALILLQGERTPHVHRRLGGERAFEIPCKAVRSVSILGWQVGQRHGYHVVGQRHEVIRRAVRPDLSG